MRGSRTRRPHRLAARLLGTLLVAVVVSGGFSVRVSAEGGVSRDGGGFTRLGGSPANSQGAPRVSPLGGSRTGWQAEAPVTPAQAPVPEGQTSPNDLERVQSDLRDAAGDRIFFAAGDARIGARSRAALARQARFLRDNPGILVVIDGHADEAGAAKSVMALSQARAEAVARLLIEEGVARERISTLGHGTSERVADCPSPACAAQNRRAVTRVVGAPVRVTPQSFSNRQPIVPYSGLGAGDIIPTPRR